MKQNKYSMCNPIVQNIILIYDTYILEFSLYNIIS